MITVLLTVEPRYSDVHFVTSHLLLQYRGFPLFEAKNVLVPRTPVGNNQFLALVWSRFKIRLAQYIMEDQFIVS